MAIPYRAAAAWQARNRLLGDSSEDASVSTARTEEPTQATLAPAENVGEATRGVSSDVTAHRHRDFRRYRLYRRLPSMETNALPQPPCPPTPPACDPSTGLVASVVDVHVGATATGTRRQGGRTGPTYTAGAASGREEVLITRVRDLGVATAPPS